MVNCFNTNRVVLKTVNIKDTDIFCLSFLSVLCIAFSHLTRRDIYIFLKPQTQKPNQEHSWVKCLITVFT